MSFRVRLRGVNARDCFQFIGRERRLGLLLDLTSKEDNKGSDILEWLDQQPPRSVVFLCFHGGFSEKQAREIALALFSLVYPSSMSARRVHKSGRSSPGRVIGLS
ncbi:hypothetical protein Bca52824_045647 [Brassica carinata]|uniref:Uncharacterized protein n=1 Tax=Brassica carinata TaxID=52824 RepID=A0A8X7RB25_BRACI|nr:hypothetical protein Bca52824_045647 [Brassica carinata]